VPRNGDELKRLFDLTFHKEPFVPKLFMPQLYHQFFDGCHDEKTQLLDELPSNKDKIKAHPDTPTLILWGEDDAIFNIQYAPKLQQELSAELITVPGAGHGLPAEMPSQFNTNLLSFLKRIDAQAN
jgi:pimeloyl-ACP methyl ester carboxylesterase